MHTVSYLRLGASNRRFSASHPISFAAKQDFDNRCGKPADDLRSFFDIGDCVPLSGSLDDRAEHILVSRAFQNQMKLCDRMSPLLHDPRGTYVAIGVWSTGANFQDLQKKVQRICQQNPKAQCLLIKMTLDSPNGSDLRYEGGLGLHTICMKVELSQPPRIQYVDPLGMPPSGPLRAAIMEVFPGAQITWLPKQQQFVEKQGFICANWTWANLEALKAGRPLPDSSQLEEILRGQRQLVERGWRDRRDIGGLLLAFAIRVNQAVSNIRKRI